MLVGHCIHNSTAHFVLGIQRNITTSMSRWINFKFQNAPIWGWYIHSCCRCVWPLRPLLASARTGPCCTRDLLAGWTQSLYFPSPSPLSRTQHPERNTHTRKHTHDKVRLVIHRWLDLMFVPGDGSYFSVGMNATLRTVAPIRSELQSGGEWDES